MSDPGTGDFQPASALVDIGSEHETKHNLTEWLEANGATVWWEETNDWGHPTFDIEHDGTSGIPDLVVEIGGYTLVVEYKAGTGVGQLYDALFQLGGYWVEYATSEQRYELDGKPVSIDGFLTASYHSPKGRLFGSYAEVRHNNADMDKGRRNCHNYDQLPPSEYRMTEQHIRCLWRYVKDATGKAFATSTETPNIGGLLSDALETPSEQPHPAVLWNQGPTGQKWEVFHE